MALFTVTAKLTASGRRYYSGHFRGETAEAAMESCKRFCNFASGTWISWTSKPYVRRARRVPVATLNAEDATARAALGETDDCTVKALARVLEVPYKDAHAALELAGRERGKGTYTYLISKAAAILGFEAICARFGGWSAGEKRIPSPTLRTYMKQPAYRALVNVSNHSVAVIDGQVIDDNGSSDLRRIDEVWTFKKESTKLLTEPTCSATV